MTIVKAPDFESKEQAQDFVRNEIKIGEVLPDRRINERIRNYMAAVSLYRLKLAGAVWFDGEPNPEDMTIRVNKISQDDLAEKTKPYFGITRSLLEALCKLLDKPEWAE